MPPVGFETTISAGERPQTYALDRAATGTGYHIQYRCIYCRLRKSAPASKIICAYIKFRFQSKLLNPS